MTRSDDTSKMATVVTESEPVRRVRSQPIAGITRRRRQFLWEHRLPLGELTLWVGHAGIGKSQAAVWLAAQVSRGILPGELHGQPSNVLYLGTEDSWEYTLASRFDAAGADPYRVHRLFVETATGDEAIVSLSVDLETLRAEIEHTGARLVVLDALVSTFGSAKLTEQGVVRRHLEPLARLAQELNIAVIGVAHFRKASDPNPLHMISGSAEFGQVVRSAIGFAADREADDGSCVLSLVKTNIAPASTPSLRYRVAPAVVNTSEGPTDVGRFEPLEETATSVGELLNQDAGSSDERAERDEAAEFIRDYLTNKGGEAPSAEVIKAAVDTLGMSKTTLTRARHRIGVKSRKAGMGGGWVWSIDPNPDRPAGGEEIEEFTKEPKNPGDTSLNSSVSSVNPSSGAPTSHSQDFGPCIRCHTTTRRYGEGGKALCPDCQNNQKGTAA